MNLANSLLKLFTFNLKDKFEREHLARMQSLSVACIVLIIFFITLSIFSFFSNFIISGGIYLSVTIVLSILLNLLSKNKFENNLVRLTIIIPGLALLFLLCTSSYTVLAIIAISLFPLLAISTLGHYKGVSYTAGMGLLYIVILFVPVNLSQHITNTSINIKIVGAIGFFTTFVVIYLFDVIRISLLNQMEKELLDQKSSLKLKEDFIANLSHQIRTPLNNIMVVANILENISSDEKQKDMIDTIHASTNNLVNVVNSMVEISNVDIKERGSINLTFNLYSTINSTIKLFSTQNSNQTNFTLKVDETIPQNLIGDPVRVKQIFLNLIESILKNRSTSKANVSIKVSKMKEKTDEIELGIEIVSNKPILLPLNEGHNLFVTNESSLTSASTQMYIDLLELSITQKLIESNGGKLSIKLSSEDAIFSFPYALNKVSQKTDTKSPEIVDKIVPPKDEAPISGSVELENASVLLVEDNLINQKIVVLSLKKLVKTIEIANNGKEALDKFGTSRFDIILMDIQMPIMNGIVATKKIREIEASSNSHTPIIAITANALLGDKEECLAAGMDDYISKPFQIEVLIQKMKNLLKSS
jgi:CheY-like chemotaxis protein/signal transduction histidine kinase